MQQTENQLNRILEKVQQLSKQQLQLSKENQQLKAELKKMIAEKNQLNEKMAVLQQQAEIQQFANGEMEPAQKKAFEKKLNGYISEIDRCITFLNS